MKKLILAAFSILVGMINVNAQTLNEGFENGVPPNDWTSYNYDYLSSQWGLNSLLPVAGNYVARLTSYTSSTNHDDWLVFPKLAITSTTDSVHFFSRKEGSGLPPHILDLKVSTTGKDTASFTTTLASITPGDLWTRYSFDLGAYDGQDIYVALHTTSVGNSHLFVDSVTGPTLFVPTCETISYVNTTNITHNSAEFTWDSISNADSYTYEIFEDGFGPAGTVLATGSITDTTVVVNGLPVATDLEIWITTDCGATDGLSEVDGPYTFSTTCGPHEEAYLETFSTFTPECWEIYEGLIELNSTLTNPITQRWRSDDFANNNSNSLGAVVNIYTSNDNDWLVSPTLQLDSISNSRISFFAALTQWDQPIPSNFNDFEDDDSVHVVISTDNGITWSDTNILYSFSSSNFPSHTGDYYSIPLDGYSGQVKIAFYAETTSSLTSTDVDFSIDDFRWSETPSCDIVAQISVDSLDAFNAYISWDTTTNATDFLVEYGAPGFALGTGTQITVTGALNTVLTNLTATTDYEVYVAPICSSTDTGDFQLSALFTTDCAPLTTYFTEDFSTYLPNDCWFEASGTTLTDTTTINPVPWGSWIGDDWLNNTTGTNDAARVNIGGSFLRQWLVTESINLDSMPYSQVEFDAGITNSGSTTADNMGPDDRVVVLISTNNGASWLEANAIYTITENNQPSNTGTHYSIPITTYSGNVKFAFYAESTVNNTYYDFFVDNFQISEAPSCLPTLDYTVVAVGDTTATISWGNINGVNDYIVEYGESGFTLGTGTTTTVTTGTSINLIGLDPVTTYDFYVRAICSPTDSANFLFHTSFTTECLTLSTTVLEEFNSVAPDCWYESEGELTASTSLVGNTSGWTEDGYLNVGNSGSARMRIFGDDEYHWLVSPSIFLGTQEKQIEFDAGQTIPTGTGSAAFASDDRLAVVISLDDGATWSESNVILEFNQATPLLNGGGHYTASLSDFVGAGNVRIGFYAQSEITNLQLNAYVDNFELKDLDTTAVDLDLIGIEVPDTFCSGEMVSLSSIVQNSGFVTVPTYPLQVEIVGPTTYNNIQSYFANIMVDELDTIEIMTLQGLQPGNYTVEIKVLANGDVNGLNNTFTKEFYVSDYPNVFAGSDITICYGESFTLDATGASTYAWSGGFSNGDVVTPTTTTTYIVSGANSVGCTTLDTIVVDVEINAAPTILYINQLLLTDELYLNYYWQFDGNTVGTNSTYAITENGIYTLVAETFSGCEVINTYNVMGIGLTEVSDYGIIVHPNPVADKLFVESDKTLEDIKIFDLNGRKVIEGGLIDAKTLDVSVLEEGIYILYGTVEGQPFQTKFTKQ